MMQNPDEEQRYCFAHCDNIYVDDLAHSLVRTRHCIEFYSDISCDDTFGLQFHPEKGHQFRMKTPNIFFQNMAPCLAVILVLFFCFVARAS